MGNNDGISLQPQKPHFIYVQLELFVIMKIFMNLKQIPVNNLPNFISTLFCCICNGFNWTLALISWLATSYPQRRTVEFVFCTSHNVVALNFMPRVRWERERERESGQMKSTVIVCAIECACFNYYCYE